MSNKNRRNQQTVAGLFGAELTTEKVVSQPAQTDSSTKLRIIPYLKAHLWMVAVIGFLALGTLGAGLKYLEEDATRELAKRASNKGNLNNQTEQSSLLNKLNPFLPTPTPVPTPQLSKELVYSGNRLLSVEDANATASAPPADLAIWRPGSGEWWVMGRQGSQQVTQGWGINGDIPVPGDYDGDGKTDFSIFRPTTSTWWILRSSDGGYWSNSFGQSGDKTAQADFDGDGRTDVAILRPDTNTQLATWYIQRTSDGGTTILQFGLDTDTPAPADYDGDGRADIGVYRSSNNAFYSINSSSNQLQYPPPGQVGNKVVSADYDGDGKADYAVYNSSTANWSVRQSTNGQVVGTQWGAANDIAVQNDYDGDGKCDIAVWHNDGTWTIKQSATNTTRTAHWGQAGDIPVPAFYRR
jgi:hypothetical protein